MTSEDRGEGLLKIVRAWPLMRSEDGEEGIDGAVTQLVDTEFEFNLAIWHSFLDSRTHCTSSSRENKQLSLCTRTFQQKAVGSHAQIARFYISYQMTG